MSTQRIDEIVRRLVRWHIEIEDSIERIVWFKDGESKVIHLLEVNRDTFPEDKILVFYHRPTSEYPLPVRLADVTPQEWEKVKKGLIPLPEGWKLENTEVFEREEFMRRMGANANAEARVTHASAR